MKKLTSIFLIAVIAISTVAFVSTKKDNTEFETSKIEFLSFLEEAKSYTIELAEAMPADKYTFKPHDSIRSFGEQMAHIGMSSKFLMEMFVNGQSMPGPEAFAEMAKMEKEMGADKEKCIATLNATFAAIKDTYKGMSKEQLKETFVVPFDPKKPEFSKKKAFSFIKDHMIHHRGQALVSLRMQGIKAPQYRLY